MSDLDRLNRVATLTAHHRPRFHVRPPWGYLNDPNGPIVLGEVAHLYFQFRPITDLTVPVEWGHATSTDFIRWQLHRPAMAPVPDGLDRDGCWSGNTVLDDGRVRAFYSGKINESPYQSVLTAISDDGGYTFGAPELVIPDPAPDEGVTTYRDPFVWQADGQWLMAVGVGYADEVAAIRLYASSDLRDWMRIDDLASLPRHFVDGTDLGSAWECPQILDLGGHTVAVVGTWTPSSGPMEVLAFAADAPSHPELVDHGTNFYAASALRDSPYGPLLFGWVTEGCDQLRWTKAGWAGALSLPRQVWWAEDGSLRSAPVPSVTELRLGQARPADGAAIGPQSEIVAPTAPARLRLRFGETEHVEVVLDAEADTLTIDRTNASADLADGGRAMTAPGAFDAATGRPAARIFVDGSIIEVFASAGRVLTTRVYPVNPPPWHLETTADGQVWELAPGT